MRTAAGTLSGGRYEDTMTREQRIWARSRDGLAKAVASLGYPEEFAGLLAKQLGSPKAIDRLASYIRLAQPGSVEMIVDEMLAIRSEIEAWREKKEFLIAQEGYYRWLASEERKSLEGEEDEYAEIRVAEESVQEAVCSCQGDFL